MRQRLVEETERFLRYRRPLAVMAIRAKPASATQEEELLQAVSKAVRVVDVVAWDGRQELWILFPETSDTAMVPAQRVLAGVIKVVPSASAGLSRCPLDGIDPEGLISSARLAARQAAAGEVISVTEADHALQVGERRIIAADPLMRSLFELVRRIAASEIPVLIMGETGAGKEIIAQAVHAWSKRHAARMVSINCAAMSETLLESELFGHEKGAFTGASATKAGLFEEASGGTVFLDEIGECSPRTQAELLRVLETKRFSRVGSLRERTANVRIVAATNRPLEDEIRAGRFRQDLYFRLNTATVTVPPLRDRPLDLPVLARNFLQEGSAREGRPTMTLSSDAIQRIALHDWPGNIRELRNLMDFLAATVQQDVVEARDLPPTVAANAAPWMLPKSQAKSQAPSQTPRLPGLTPRPQGPRKQFRKLQDEIQELEMLRIREALEEAQGVRNRAAELIGMPLRTLVTKIKTYGLGPAPPRSRKLDKSQD
jgi:DNA-binding NtrC family response regulator